MTIQDKRKVINRIDQEMRDLFVERLACTSAIAQIKADQGLPVYDRIRENEILSGYPSVLTGVDQAYYGWFLRSLLLMSRSHQYGVMTTTQAQVSQDLGLGDYVAQGQTVHLDLTFTAADDFYLQLNLFLLYQIPLTRLHCTRMQEGVTLFQLIFKADFSRQATMVLLTQLACETSDLTCQVREVET